jgi:alpha-ketoglutaric semialdehyde dehydrogenase
MNFIAGSWAGSADGRTYERENPADPSILIGAFPDSARADAHRAARAARENFAAWAAAPAQHRAEILATAAGLLRERHADIAGKLTAEEGKPLARADGEVLRAADALTYFAHGAMRATGRTIPSARPGVVLSTYAEPLGPFLAITPFNFPLFVTALKLGPALASGNTVVWKPSPHVPLVSIALMAAFIDAGLPSGVLNLVLGGTAELGRSLVGEPDIVGVSFTGSTAVGLDVGRRGAARHIRVQQEMGGKNVLVVAADCDIRRAAEIACESSFGESGQKCTASGLVVVDKRRGDEFLAETERILGGMTMGDGADPGTSLGPLIDRGAVTRAGRLVDQAVESGAVSELSGCGGSTAIADGYYFAPRVLRLPDGDNVLKRQETFAPVLAVALAADAVECGLAMATGSRMGLSASILTNSLDLAQEFARRVPAGLVNVNLPTTGVEYQAPFGGWNLSGGPFPEAGDRAHEFYTRSKTVAVSGVL